MMIYLILDFKHCNTFRCVEGLTQHQNLLGLIFLFSIHHTTPVDYFARDLSSATKLLTLAFIDGKKEQDYQHHKETNSSLSIIGCPIALLLTSVAQMVILPRLVTPNSTVVDISFLFWGKGGGEARF